MKVYQEIAQALIQRQHPAEAAQLAAADRIAAAEYELPSGSGFDSGSRVDLDASTPERIVITTAYHHMDEGGTYDVWTEHQVIITPSLAWGYQVRVTGRDREGIKRYIEDEFAECLDAEMPTR